MFDLINGLPVHPLVVHAVVVLVPLAILGTIAIAVRPRWRTSYGPLVVAIAAVGTALVPVATSSGEALQKRIGDPGEHAALGDQLLWFALPVLVLSLALVVLAFRERSRTADGKTAVVPRTSSAARIVAIVAVVTSLACAVQVYRVGDSGAKAVWADQVGAAAPAPAGD